MGVGRGVTGIKSFLAQSGGHKLQKKDNFTGGAGGRSTGLAASLAVSGIRCDKPGAVQALGCLVLPNVRDYGVQEN